MACAGIKEKFAGKWNLDKSENMDNYLQQMDIGFIKRKAAGAMNIKLTISVENDEVVIQRETAIKTAINKFKPGEEKEIKEEDRTARVTLTLEGEVMKIVTNPQGGKGKPSVVERKVDGDVMTQTMTCNGVVAKMVFKRVA